MEGTLAFVVGVLMCINAAINLLILLCHPEFRNGTLTSDMDPTIRYSNAHAVCILDNLLTRVASCYS
jgi:hypothetical protein